MTNSNNSFDIAVIGGGIFGLWIAKYAVESGAKVLLADAGKIGSGASGGLLGALMPHIPDRWKEKKQFQFEALTELPKLIATLETETSLSTGYGQIGRIMPIREKHYIEIADERERGAIVNWWQGCKTYTFKTEETARYAGWINSDLAKYGVMHDSLGARVNPKLLCAALKAWLEPRCTIRENWKLDDVTQLSFNNGVETVKANHTVFTFGYQTFDKLRSHHDIGSGIKGQAALYDLDFKDMPVIYDDGVYIVPHDNGTVAVGSTSEKQWSNPTEPELKNIEFLTKARALCPPLQDIEPSQHWAGVRPKCHKREPIVGQLPDLENTWIATGGFKVSFGIAHRIAEYLINQMNGNTTAIDLPSTFKIDHHLTS